MPREQKKSSSQNLASYEVLIEDTSYYSDYFRVSNFNPLFTSGRNGFLVGGTGRLRPHSSILIDVTDSAGNPVFYAPVANYVEGGSRLIQVEVYNNTPKGPGSLVLMGEALQMPDGSPIPREWQGRYNIRWKIPVHIEPRRRNTTSIRFISTPNISVIESPNQPTRDITRTYVSESNYNMNLVQLVEGVIRKGYYIELNVPPSGSPVDNNFYFTDVKLGGLFTGSLIRTEKRVVEDDIGTPISVDYVFPSSSVDLNIAVSRIFNNRYGFTTSSITFSDGKELVNLRNLVNGQFRDEVSYDSFISGGSTYYSRSVVDYTSSLEFRYPVDPWEIVPFRSSSILTFRLNNLSTSTGEVARIAISSKPFLDEFSAFETLYEFQPGISNVLVESGSSIQATTADRQFSIGQFVSSSYPHEYWVSSYITSSGFFDTQYYNTGSEPHIPLVTSSFQPGLNTMGVGSLLNGMYAHETSSLFPSSFFIGTRKPYAFFKATEYTLEYSLSYLQTSTFPNSDTWPTPHSYNSRTGRVQVYLAPHTSSLAQSDKNQSAVPIRDDSMGLLIDEIVVTNQDKANFYNRKANFTVPRDGYGHLRFVVLSGYWEFADVSLYPSEEYGFSFDEVSFTAENTEVVDSTHIFKAEFFDIDNNSVNLSVLSNPKAIIGPVTPPLLPYISGSSYATLTDLNNIYHSTGWIRGGEITDDGDGTITVNSGSGVIRIANDRLSELQFFDWDLTTGSTIDIGDQTARWICVDYNAGSPIVTASVDEPNQYNQMTLGWVYREGSYFHISSMVLQINIQDHASNMNRRLEEIQPFARVSGGVLSETGSLAMQVTAGEFWEGLNRFTTDQISTFSVPFEGYYRSGSGWTETGSQTYIDNIHYDDDSGTLAALGPAEYGVHWVYLSHDSDLLTIYGQDDYATLAQAQAATVPATTPDSFGPHTKLIGKIILQQGDSSFTSVETVWTTTFTGTSVSAHNDLSGLQGGTAGEYYHLTAAEYAALGVDFWYEGVTDFTIKGGTGTPTSSLHVTGAIDLFGGATPYTHTFPPATTTLVGTDVVQTLTNKIVTGSFSGSGTGVYGVNYNSLVNIPSAIVSSSIQVKTLLPVGVVSSSAQTKALLPEGTVSSSGQVVYTSLSSIPAGIVSGSEQIKSLTSSSVSMYVIPSGSDIVVGDGQTYFTIPSNVSGKNLVRVSAKVITSGSTGTTDIQIRNVTDSVDMLSTKITIDSDEYGSETAATPPVINGATDDVVEYDLIAIDVDAVSTTPPTGLVVSLTFA